MRTICACREPGDILTSSIVQLHVKTVALAFGQLIACRA